MQHAGAAVDDLGRLLHLVGRRRGEDLAGARRVEHAEADEAAVQRLVARAAARDQRDLARPSGVAAVDDAVGVVDLQLGVRGGDADEGVGQHVLGSLMSFFMPGVSSRSAASAQAGLGQRWVREISPNSSAAATPASEFGDNVDRPLLPVHGAAEQLLHEHRAGGAGRVDRGAGGRGDRDDRGEDDETDREPGESRSRLAVDDAEDREDQDEGADELGDERLPSTVIVAVGRDAEAELAGLLPSTPTIANAPSDRTQHLGGR